jgi:hypothetical protein
MSRKFPRASDNDDDSEGFLLPEHDQRSYVNRLARLVDLTDHRESVDWLISVRRDDSVTRTLGGRPSTAAAAGNGEVGVEAIREG